MYYRAKRTVVVLRFLFGVITAMSVTVPALGQNFDQCEQSAELFKQALSRHRADHDRAIRLYHEAFFSAASTLQEQIEDQGSLSKSCLELLDAQSKVREAILSTAFPEVTESDLMLARKRDSARTYASILDAKGIHEKVLPALFLESDLLRVRAQLALWYVYVDGAENVTHRYSKQILEYYKSRAAWGVSRFQYYLGLIYLHGLGVLKDGNKAETLLRKASSNVTDAARELGSYYYREREDLVEGEKYLLIAASAADAEAHYELGDLYFCAKQYDLALDHFKQSFHIDPSADNSHALLWVGKIYLEVKRECKIALEALENAAHHFNNYSAQYYLSVFYRAKEGYRSECIEPNPQKGLEYLKAAAVQGDELAAEELKGK